jgi:outer membrane lipoprotein-sorting protein
MRYHGRCVSRFVSTVYTHACKVALAAVFPILASVPGQAQFDVREALAKVSETYSSAAQYEFAIHTTSSDAASVPFFLHVAVKKPDRLRMEVTLKERSKSDPSANPDDAITVADGEYTWIYSPKLAQYTKRKDASAFVSHAEEQLFVRYRNALRGAGRARALREESLELDGRSVSCYVIEIADDSRSELHTWWIDKSRYLVLREDLAKGQYRESAVYTVARMNEPLPLDLFVFSPPAGAKQVEKFKN